MKRFTKADWRRLVPYIRFTAFITVFLSIFLLIGILGLYVYTKMEGPPPLAVQQTSVYYGSGGEKLGESHNGQNRHWVKLNDVSEAAIEATISIEDKKFFSHRGFDYKRIAGAALADLKAMAKVQGASTITQQYARNLYLGHDKTWKRKLKEALYTLRLEVNYTKEQILEGYLNTIYYGHGIYGIEAAANFYFDKPASELTIGEASLLSGIPKGPARYSPLINKDNAISRQENVLAAMVSTGTLTEGEAEKARGEELTFRTKQKEEKPLLAPYFLDVVKKQLKSDVKLDEQTIEMGGLKVYTTLDPSIQKIAEEKVKETIAPDSGIQAAVVVMDPQTGEVKALVGGRDYADSPFNRAVQAKRQPGSTFKPILYYAAIESGFTPATQLSSEPTAFRYDDGNSVYKPSNFNDYYADGPITLAQAIALSDNIFAVKTNMYLQPENLVETAKRLGIKSKLKAVPSLALGTSPVTPLEMTGAFSRLASGGKNTVPVFIKKVVDYEGNVLYERDQEPRQKLDEAAAFVTAHMMTGMFDESLNDYTRVTGKPIKHKLTRPYAGKSGTTRADSWMIGFSPQLITSVWVGYDKGQTINLVEERTYAKEIWADLMEEALKDEKTGGFTPPDGVVAATIDPHTGKLATKACPAVHLAYFIEGTEPVDYCDDHFEDRQPAPAEGEKEEKKGLFKRIIDWLG
ncbi:transglycosylase domain-containing protein [Bacillus marinisedimentorum]|uniref:transglycosylase domain-containing protein n=1 Tax=Bacillus marinisedimentorum TaxID=1821260 RepID=UPI0007E1D2A2|nr:PBP1A family penicillin-binding protein [Bacillus marinisedimentorum]